MPRKKWIDKKTAQSFSLVHRAQNDPRIHDAEASDMVFRPLVPSNQKIKTRNDLEEELGLNPATVRDNEGEAANYGVFYDDTSYDYMQHMRDLGGSVEATFVEAKGEKAKGKGKQRLEDALRDVRLDDDESKFGGVDIGVPETMLDADLLPSKQLQRRTYQDQQDVPDTLAGFQPDMDPRLREVLEALEDEAYVDDDDDIFGELAQDGEEVSVDEFEGVGWEDGEEDAGWETDDTAKPNKEYKATAASQVTDPQDIVMGEGTDHGDGDWMKEFSKFKKVEKAKKERPPPSNSELQSSLMTSSSMASGRRKKRKGAMTSSTGYSMTSSSLFRTEGLTLLDDRFDKIEEDYAEDEMDDGVSISTGTSAASQGGSVRQDFDSIMDEFLGGYSASGKKRIKKGGYQTGIEQLDEVRRGLGPARLRPQKA
ncbi:MAG: hypothetical protein M1835_000102 [Candelina submexicana]|nr:MAG: hypothetical protein M1835_000102 [Candelina submexicana]